MKKTRKINLISTLVALGVMAITLTLYVIDLVVNKSPYNAHLLEVVMIGSSCILALTKIYSGTNPKPATLKKCEAAYKNELGDAFEDNPELRRELLIACHLMNRGGLRNALQRLEDLLELAKTEQEKVAISLFSALCSEDLRRYDLAITRYNDILALRPTYAQVHSNLGIVYAKKGDLDNALTHYNFAICYEPNNYHAYVNRANYYFDVNEYDKAEEDALTAIGIKYDSVEAAEILVLIYSLGENMEKKNHYLNIAVQNGSDPAQLNSLIKKIKDKSKKN